MVNDFTTQEIQVDKTKYMVFAFFLMRLMVLGTYTAPSKSENWQEPLELFITPKFYSHLSGQISCFGVTSCDGGVAPQQQVMHRSAYNLTAANHHRSLPRHSNACRDRMNASVIPV